MPARFVTVDRETPLLLPQDLREWVPEDHLVHFVIDAVDQLDVSSARINQRGSGSQQYPPAMMLGLLVYSYATGGFASRRIEQSTFDNLAVRLLCADTHPDHDTICAFRRENRELLAGGFTRVLELAARCGQRPGRRRDYQPADRRPARDPGHQRQGATGPDPAWDRTGRRDRERGSGRQRFCQRKGRPRSRRR